MAADKDARPGVSRPGVESTVPNWNDTYSAAEEWVARNARKRWPDWPANDQIWAASVASWWLS